MDQGPELRYLISLGEANLDVAEESRVEEVALDRLPCEIALGDLPSPEAFPAEATDYVIHFFGLNCYARWRTLQDGN